MVIKRFKDFIKKIKTADRSRHMAWGPEDIETHEPPPPDDRSNHLGWGTEHVEIHKENLDEDFDHSKVKTGVGGLVSLGKKPRYWEKGKAQPSPHNGMPSNSIRNPVNKDRPESPKVPPSNFDDNPDQLKMKFKGEKLPKPPKPGQTFSPKLEEHHKHSDVVDHFYDHSVKVEDRNMTRHIEHYKEDSYELNGQLRENKGRIKAGYGFENFKRGLDKITSHRTSQDYTVFRGIHTNKDIHGLVPVIKGKPTRFHDMKPGQEFTDHGYTGASLSPTRAQGFSHNSKDVFRIHVPKGSMAHYFDAHSNSHAHEKEMVLHRGSRFRVKGHTQGENGEHIIDLHLVRQRKNTETL